MILLEISSYAAYANTSIFEGSLAWTIHLTYQEPYNLNVHLIMLKLLRDGSCGDMWIFSSSLFAAAGDCSKRPVHGHREQHLSNASPPSHWRISTKTELELHFQSLQLIFNTVELTPNYTLYTELYTDKHTFVKKAFA